MTDLEAAVFRAALQWARAEEDLRRHNYGGRATGEREHVISISADWTEQKLIEAVRAYNAGLLTEKPKKTAAKKR